MFKDRESGASLVEYALLVSAITLSSFFVLQDIGWSLEQCNHDLAQELLALNNSEFDDDGGFTGDGDGDGNDDGGWGVGGTQSSMCRPVRPNNNNADDNANGNGGDPLD